jgi:hypothetical protein
MTTTVINISLAQLPGQYRKLGTRLPAAARRGALRGALRAVQTLQRATGLVPPASPYGATGAVNTGFYKRAWKYEALPDGARVFNAAGYASVIEYGRRPGRFPPTAAIVDWAQRRLGLSREEAKRAAFPIARAIAKRGLQPRRTMTDQLPGIEKDFFEELLKELDRELAKP